MATAVREIHDSLADALSQTAEALRRSTLHVRSGRHGSGSGVIWSADGLVITNAHVVRGSSATVELWDGRILEAEVTARDPRRDLAALQVQAGDLPAAPIADSDTLRVGQIAVAVGNPLGLTGALTVGIIHAIAPAEGHGWQTWVQADVHLAPGNSGGPLADGLGRVIGINSMTVGSLGLAVPSNAVASFLRERAARPQLGITTQPVTVSLLNDSVSGLLVLETVPRGAAERAGVMLGDVVVGSRGRRFTDPRHLIDVLQPGVEGDTLQLDILRGGLLQAVSITLSTGDHTTSVEEGIGVAA
ncbi:MAG: trypsin-like peptidase domain-containing protein [Chloroflexota bacterium]|nr:trypsin-like peptidase domain-containing protein [Chloroflexota bacterium]